MNRLVLALIVFIACVAAPAALRADEIIFKNGDQLTGKIETFDGTAITVSGTPAGKVTVDMKTVKTFSSDGPIDVVLADGSVIHQKVLAGPDGQIILAPGG